jgi:hypothetical protein
MEVGWNLVVFYEASTLRLGSGRSRKWPVALERKSSMEFGRFRISASGKTWYFTNFSSLLILVLVEQTEIWNCALSFPTQFTSS